MMSHTGNDSAPQTTSSNIESIYPLSPTQQGILFHTVYAPGSGVYVIQLRLTLRGHLNLDCFQRAWQSVIDQHPALRTLFAWKGRDKPLQVVYAKVKCGWTECDWQHLDAKGQENELLRWLQADRARGFSLDKAPLMRMMLARTGPDTSELIWTYHHLVLDGWSTFRVLAQVMDTYDALQQGRPLSTYPVPPYKEYVTWLADQDLAAAETFWKQALRGVQPTSLALARPSQPQDTSGADDDVPGRGEQLLVLSSANTASLQAAARHLHVTLNTLAQGVWGLLLSFYSGERDVVFGGTSSGRTAGPPGIEDMVGLFINTLPVRIRMDPNITLIEYLAELQAAQAEARQYEYSPLSLVQRWSGVPTGENLFDSIFVFENYPGGMLIGATKGGVRLESVRSYEKTNYPLTVAVDPGERFTLRVRYDHDSYDDDAIQRMLWHYQTLLDAVIAQPEQRLSEFQILPEPERRRLLVEWNHTATPYEQSLCIHEQFEAQVARTPDAIAVLAENGQATYAELNRRANQLARHLAKFKIGPGSLVGLCVERSVDMTIGLLGILKAGAAFVPLDPAYPAQRLAFMLQDSRAAALVTQDELRPPDFAGRTVLVDRDAAAIRLESDGDLGRTASPDDAAYVIYTSGSTGNPKGVVVQHRSVSNLLTALDHAVYADANRPLRVSLNGSLNFDTSVKQWVQLLRGRTLVVIPENIRMDGWGLLDFLVKYEVDVLDCPPSQLSLLLGAGLLEHPGHVPSRVLAAGEAIGTQMWQTIARSTRIAFYNLYGPTECTVDAAIGRVAAQDARPNIGRPIANVRLYILNRDLNPVPLGVPGELFIGGEGVTRGYLHHPELTAAHFLPDPFSDNPGVRMYRTGDWVRYLPNGKVEFLTRADHQIKLRGFRIELEEIESAVQQYPGVADAVVTAWAENGDDLEKRLVTYFTTDKRRVIDVAELRRFLTGRLPDYMLPSAFVALDHLPLLPNGKIDRRSLPDPESSERFVQGVYVPPRDVLELQLAHIWETVLGVRPVGVTDDFFDLGGHSLLALRLMALIRQSFKQDLPLATLLQRATVEELAKLLRRDREALAQPPPLLVRFQAGALPPPLFLVHPVGGNVLCYAELVENLSLDRPVYGLRARGLEEECEPFTQLEEMATCYLEMVRSIQPTGPYSLCGWSMGGLVAFEMATQLSKQGQGIELLALLDSQAHYPGESNGSSRPSSDTIGLSGLAPEFLEELGVPREASRALRDLNLDSLSPDERLRIILSHATRYSVIPPDSGIDQVRRLWRVFQANRQALARYVPQAYSGPITLFHAQENGNGSATLGWEQVARGCLEDHQTPGTHRTMLTRPNVQVLAARLRECIGNSSRSEPSKNS